MSVYISYGTEYLSRHLREHRCRLGLALAYVSKVVDISVKDLEQYEYGYKSITNASSEGWFVQQESILSG